MELHENNYASKALGGTALGFGIGGAALAAMNSGLLGNFGIGRAGCGGEVPFSRYDAEQAAKISALEAEVKYRDSVTYILEEVNKVRNYYDNEIKGINAQLCQQAVINAQLGSTVGCLQNSINVLNGLTKTVIPAANICPVPTTTTTAG